MRTTKRAIALAVSLALSVGVLGCGVEGEDDSNNHGYGTNFDFSTSSGTRFRNDPPTVVLRQSDVDFFIDKPYQETEKCTQILTEGPLVIAVPSGSLGDHGGFTYFDTGLVLITDFNVFDGWNNQSIVRHEYVHYLLAASGFPNDQNRNHQSPLFVQCSGIGG